MTAGELAERLRHRPVDERSKQEREDDGRTGDANRRSRSEQQAGPDRPAHRHHRHLAGGELAS
jgi:hypothetical protein